MEKLKKSNIIKQRINQHNSEYETINIYERDNINVQLKYPKNKEYKVKDFINETRQEFVDILSEFQMDKSNITIIINESGEDLPVYNTNPYGDESSKTLSYTNIKRTFSTFSQRFATLQIRSQVKNNIDLR